MNVRRTWVAVGFAAVVALAAIHSCGGSTTPETNTGGQGGGTGITIPSYGPVPGTVFSPEPTPLASPSPVVVTDLGEQNIRTEVLNNWKALTAKMSATNVTSAQ